MSSALHKFLFIPTTVHTRSLCLVGASLVPDNKVQGIIAEAFSYRQRKVATMTGKERGSIGAKEGALRKRLHGSVKWEAVSERGRIKGERLTLLPPCKHILYYSCVTVVSRLFCECLFFLDLLRRTGL